MTQEERTKVIIDCIQNPSMEKMNVLLDSYNSYQRAMLAAATLETTKRVKSLFGDDLVAMATVILLTLHGLKLSLEIKSANTANESSIIE